MRTTKDIMILQVSLLHHLQAAQLAQRARRERKTALQRPTHLRDKVKLATIQNMSLRSTPK